MPNHLITRHIAAEVTHQLANPPKHEFVIKVDWDLDYFGPEGCHGTDYFFQDDPIELTFTENPDGSFYVAGFDLGYLVTANNDLKPIYHKYTCVDEPTKRCGIVEKVMDRTIFPIKRVTRSGKSAVHTKNFAYVGYIANEEFYECYKKSTTSKNDPLSDNEEVIVERFFEAVRETFPYFYSYEYEKCG